MVVMPSELNISISAWRQGASFPVFCPEVERKFWIENKRTNIRTTDFIVPSFTNFVETSMFISIIHLARIDSIILIFFKNRFT